MRARTATTAATYALLCLAGGISFMLPEQLVVTSGVAQASPDVLYLRSTVRDFHRTHPDMDVTPSGGDGHYAGNVELFAGADGRPVYTGAGHRITTQWVDASGNPIAPHMYATMDTVQVVEPVEMNNGSFMDTWDSRVGPYGGANVGPAPVIETGATMPSVSAPNLGGSVGNVTFNSSKVITQDLRCNRLVIGRDTTVRINGDRVIVCDNLFEMKSDALIELLPNATLRLYLNKGAAIKEGSNFFNTNTEDPARVTVVVLGDQKFELKTGSQMYANMYAPDGELELHNGAMFYGRFTGHTLDLDQNAGFHHDTVWVNVCGTPMLDDIGTLGAAGNGGVTSSDTFDEWFHDVLGTNFSIARFIALNRSGSIWEYLNDSYYPIDDELFGNEGDSNNKYFTTTINSSFQHTACADYFFEYEGTDDVWVFINGELVIDLGGMGTVRRQRIEADRLNLVDGQRYDFDLYHAQRQSSKSVFRIRTNIPLESKAPNTVSAGFD